MIHATVLLFFSTDVMVTSSCTYLCYWGESMQNLKKISNLLFNTFITNDTAIAVQTESGYKTVETDVTPETIEYMLRSQASIAAYQQITYKNTLRWICFDFDCTSEEQIHDLFATIVRPFITNLSAISIPYIVEFSGRRGFHVWIILDRMISKRDGFGLLSAIEKKCVPSIANSESLYHLDRFPATGAGHNKYGKAVKIPLSFHKKGCYSQMLSSDTGYAILPASVLDKDFIDGQTAILEHYHCANYSDLRDSLQLETITENYDVIPKFEYDINTPITLPAFISAATGSSVLELIVRHIQTDSLSHLDRSILVGLLSHVSDGDAILHTIMKTQSNYDENTTNVIIKKMHAYYYSLCFGQMYAYYNATLEPEIDPTTSVIEWLLKKMGIDPTSVIVAPSQNTKYSTLKDIVRKEQNYQLFNDEVIDVLILRDLQQLTSLDLSYIADWIQQIEDGSFDIPHRIAYKHHIRLECEDRERTLISLSAVDRVFTTALAFRFADLYTGFWDSFSYQINRMPGGDVFYPWLSSWNKYRKSISTFLKIPIFSDFHLIKIDIHHFYDSIRFHAIFDKCIEAIRDNTKDNAADKACNIFSFLVKYNARLMKLEKMDHGVPQGPAYARILAEFFLSVVLEEFRCAIKDTFGSVKLFRYVDDIYVLLDPKEDPQFFLDSFSGHVEKYSLFVNKEKTRVWGQLKDINPKTLDDLWAKAEENYKIQGFSNLEYYDEEDLLDPITTFQNYIMRDGKWNIGDANFLLNNAIDPLISNMYLSQYAEQIIESEIGRGSIFRKFYGMLFRNPYMINPFFERHSYNRIPVQSVNMSNMISTLFMHLKQNGEITGTSKDNIIRMCTCLLEKDLLSDDRSSIKAILAFFN